MYLLSWGYWQAKGDRTPPSPQAVRIRLPAPATQPTGRCKRSSWLCQLTSSTKKAPKPKHSPEVTSTQFQFTWIFISILILLKTPCRQIKIHCSLLLMATVNDVKWKAGSNLLTFLFFTAAASLLPLCSPSHSLVPHRTGQVWIIVTWKSRTEVFVLSASHPGL